MNKKFQVITLILFLTYSCWAQNANLEWAKSYGGDDIDIAWSNVTDNNGNIYTIGDFYGTVDFDPNDTQYTLTSMGDSDIFIQKLDINGNFIWVKQIRGNGHESGSSIAIDESGYIYATGGFEATVDFDPSNESEYVSSGGSWDVFILKLDIDGNFIWVKKIGGSSDDKGNSITTDQSGNVISTGYFEGTVDFDSGGMYQSLSSNGDYDIYILKLDSNGDFVWANQMGDITNDVGYDINTDYYGNIYTLGSFQGTVDFSAGTSNQLLTSIGNVDAFIQKLDASGNSIWVKQIGGFNAVKPASLSVDNSGNIISVGSFKGTVDFDPGNNNIELTAQGSYDTFIQKLNSDGEYLWAHNFGGSAYDAATSLVIDENESIYITGGFSESIDFDPSQLEFNLSARGSQDIFIQKLYSNGSLAWVKQLGGTNLETGYSINIDNNENLSIVGAFQGIINLYNYENEDVLVSNGIYDAIVLQIKDCHMKSSIDSISACKSYTWIDGIAYTENNNTATYTFEDDECDSLVHLNLIINNVSDTTLTLFDETIVANNTYASYQWLDCSDNFKPIDEEINNTFTALANGLYAVELNENGCVDTSQCVSLNLVSTNQSNVIPSIELYPNPTKGKFKINFERAISKGIITIYNVKGQPIQVRYFDNRNTIEFEIKQAPGIYYIKVESAIDNSLLPIVIY